MKKLSFKEIDNIITNYSNPELLQELFNLLSKEYNLNLLETELFDIIKLVLGNIDLNKWKHEN